MFYHKRKSTLVQMVSSLFWASLHNLKISFLNWKTTRWIKLHHHQNGISKFILFKTFIVENNNRLPLRHMLKMIYYQDQKNSVHQFQVGYTTHPIMKKDRTHREKVINTFSSAFKVKRMKDTK